MTTPEITNPQSLDNVVQSGEKGRDETVGKGLIKDKMIWKCFQDDMPLYTDDMDRKTNEQMFIPILPSTCCGYRKAECLSSSSKKKKSVLF